LAERGAYTRVALPLVAGFSAVSFLFLRAPGPRGLLQWLGLLLAMLGLSGVIIARWTLGRSFSVTPQARQLVTRGIYSKLRNPIYVSGTIFVTGLLVMIQKPYLWIVLGPIVIVQAVRARKEARLLEAKFGDDYRLYRNRTWF
jgi:protein-S-isoprenylcysteine O-methyltransferase Ste14